MTVPIPDPIPKPSVPQPPPPEPIPPTPQPSDPRANAQHRASFGQFIEGGELHCDQGRMVAVHIDDAETDAQPARHPRADG